MLTGCVRGAAGEMEDDDFQERPRGWTKETILYEVGFRLALLIVLGTLSCIMFFAGGAFGGSVDASVALLSRDN